MSPETSDPRRLQQRWLNRLHSLLRDPALTPEARADYEAQESFWLRASYATLNELVNCYEPGADAV